MVQAQDAAKEDSEKEVREATKCHLRALNADLQMEDAMDYTTLREEIKEIADIAASVPEAFRVTCFQLLLTNLLPAKHNAPEKQQKSDDPPKTHLNAQQEALPISTQLRVFMQKTEITEDELKSVLMVADGDVHFVREPGRVKITDGQMQWALLLALKNCILKNSLTVDPEDVRSVCQEKGFYDSANFAANFKKDRYAKFFKGPMERQGEAQLLTNDGQDELASLIRSLGTARQ
jgi:hypothetical protein